MVKRILFRLKMLWYKKVLKRDTMELKIQRYRENGVKIGRNMRAFSPPSSAEPYLLEFGDNITISTGVKFTTHDNSAVKIIPNSTDLFGRIKIGDDCFIGQNALFLPGVEIANKTIVAAGSVVTKSFKEEGKIIGGNPAKVIGTIEAYREKYGENSLNTKNKSWSEKKKYLLANEQHFLRK